jgi:hypothetical protein
MDVDRSSNNPMMIQAYGATAVSMPEVVQVLRDQGTPLCFEQLPVDPRRSRRLADGRIKYEQTTFDITVDHGPLTAALDVLIRADPEYIWQQLGDRPTYTVFPATNSALAWSIQAGYGNGLDWIAAISGLDLADHHITLFPRGLDRQLRHTLNKASDETMARRWLAAVVDQVGQGSYWNLAGLGKQRTLVIGRVAPPESPGIP